MKYQEIRCSGCEKAVDEKAMIERLLKEDSTAIVHVCRKCHFVMNINHIHYVLDYLHSQAYGVCAEEEVV